MVKVSAVKFFSTIYSSSADRKEESQQLKPAKMWRYHGSNDKILATISKVKQY